MSAVYRGERTANHALVFVSRDGGETWAILPHRYRHSPGGFSWGDQSTGSLDLALTLLRDALDREPGFSLYSEYKYAVIANLLREGWRLTRQDVRDWADTEGARIEAMEHRLRQEIESETPVREEGET